MHLPSAAPRWLGSSGSLAAPCFLTALCLLAALGGMGCRGKSIESYEPTSTAARDAVELALSTWKGGAKHGPITEVKPNINVFDARWQGGAKLESFEILEEVTGKQHPQFKVKLKVAGKPEETTDYLVVGIDPLLVFREADYLKASGM